MCFVGTDVNKNAKRLILLPMALIAYPLYGVTLNILTGLVATLLGYKSHVTFWTVSYACRLPNFDDLLIKFGPVLLILFAAAVSTKLYNPQNQTRLVKLILIQLSLLALSQFVLSSMNLFPVTAHLISKRETSSARSLGVSKYVLSPILVVVSMAILSMLAVKIKRAKENFL